MRMAQTELQKLSQSIYYKQNYVNRADENGGRTMQHLICQFGLIDGGQFTISA